MRLSVVSTLYRSAPTLWEFHARARAAALRVTPDYEIVLVNDGSPDDALAVALAVQATDPRVRVVDLSRNFGHHAAMWTGLRHARGEWVFLLDSDLEEAPEWLEQFVAERERTGADVVFGTQAARGGGALRDWGGRLFYKVFNALCDTPLPENLMTARLMSRRYLDALLSHGEVQLTIAGLWARTGFGQVALPLPKAHRRGTTYGPLRRARTFVDAVTSFSSKPLEYVFYLGALLLVLSAGMAGAVLLAKLCLGVVLDGWPSLMVSVWFLGGLILFCQGIQGVYLAKVYLEAKRRPLALVRHVHEAPEARADDGVRAAA